MRFLTRRYGEYSTSIISITSTYGRKLSALHGLWITLQRLASHSKVQDYETKVSLCMDETLPEVYGPQSVLDFLYKRYNGVRIHFTPSGQLTRLTS